MGSVGLFSTTLGDYDQYTSSIHFFTWWLYVVITRGLIKYPVHFLVLNKCRYSQLPSVHVILVGPNKTMQLCCQLDPCESEFLFNIASVSCVMFYMCMFVSMSVCPCLYGAFVFGTCTSTCQLGVFNIF